MLGNWSDRTFQRIANHDYRENGKKVGACIWHDIPRITRNERSIYSGEQIVADKGSNAH